MPEGPTWPGDVSRFVRAFEAFRRQRAELLAVVDPLPADAWERTATVTGMVGETYERTRIAAAVAARPG